MEENIKIKDMYLVILKNRAKLKLYELIGILSLNIFVIVGYALKLINNTHVVASALILIFFECVVFDRYKKCKVDVSKCNADMFQSTINSIDETDGKTYVKLENDDSVYNLNKSKINFKAGDKVAVCKLYESNSDIYDVIKA